MCDRFAGSTFAPHPGDVSSQMACWQTYLCVCQHLESICRYVVRKCLMITQLTGVGTIFTVSTIPALSPGAGLAWANRECRALWEGCSAPIPQCHIHHHIIRRDAWGRGRCYMPYRWLVFDIFLLASIFDQLKPTMRGASHNERYWIPSNSCKIHSGSLVNHYLSGSNSAWEPRAVIISQYILRQ